MREQWQIDQGNRCGCKGSDEMCPCQNVDPEMRENLRKTSPRVLIPEVQDQLRRMAAEIRIGPDGEGQDWQAMLEACVEDLDTAMKQI